MSERSNLRQFSDAELEVLKAHFDKKFKEANDKHSMEFIDIDSIFEYHMPDIGGGSIEV